MSRYQTLNVSLQTDTNNNIYNQSRLSQTIDHIPQPQLDSHDNTESDERVKKFRELYFKNQKLRKQLKILNARLNQKLEKVKFPNVKKRAASVDLNRQKQFVPPNKGLQRQLQNAYKQIKMYKKQVQVLKIKQETPQNYSKLRDMENLIAYKDMQIQQTKQQLKSIKSIKKMQERKIISQLENQDVKSRLESYQKEHEELRQQLKKMAKKTRKRDQQYKKQQAYLVSLSKKYRIANDKQPNVAPIQQQKIERPNRYISQIQFKQVKQEIANQKKINDQLLKKFQVTKKQVKTYKHEMTLDLQKIKQKQGVITQLQAKILSMQRLLGDQSKKQQKNPLILNIEDVIKEGENQHELSDVEDEKDPTISASKDLSLKKMLKQMQSGERQWKGELRKVQYGFGAPGDKKFQHKGVLKGFYVSLDENQAICGIVFLFDGDRSPRMQNIIGKRTNVELGWQLKQGDKIIKVGGCFTQQSYLNQLTIATKDKNEPIFGTASSDPFSFKINDGERISGCFGSVRDLGSDKRITQLGFWIQRKSK